MSTLADKLQWLRLYFDVQKNEIATAVNVHPSSIGNLEKGSLPKADLLYSISKYYKISMDILMDETIENDQLVNYLSVPKTESTQFPVFLHLYNQLPSDQQNEVCDWMNYKIHQNSKGVGLSSTSRAGEKAIKDNTGIA